MISKDEHIEVIIRVVADATSYGFDRKIIYQEIIARGWSKEEAYLAIKAGEILANFGKKN